MNKMKMKIWGREFTIDLIIQLFDYKEPSATQNAAWEEFQKQDPLKAALEPLKKYIISNEGKDCGINQIDNIFKYIIPRSIFIPRSGKKIVALICDYKLDSEHGIAIVFADNQLDRIGAQDIIL